MSRIELHMRVMLLVVVSFVALLLGGGVIVTWLRSSNHIDEFSINGRRRYFVQSHQGRINLGVARRWEYRNADRTKYFEVINGDTRPPDAPFVQRPHAERWWFGHRRPYLSNERSAAWFGSHRVGSSVSGSGYYDHEWGDVIFFPHWAALLVLAPVALLPLPALIRRRRRRRMRTAGRCEHCGYDLRATPGQCPECGRVTPGQATS